MASTGAYYHVGNTGEPIIVQGQPYHGQTNKKDSQTVKFSNSTTNKPMISPFAKSTNRAYEQQSGYRDVFWAILFYAQLLAIAGLAVVYIPQMQEILLEAEDNSGEEQQAYQGSVYTNHNNDNNGKSMRFLNRMMRRHLEEEADGENGDEDYNDEVNALVAFLPYCFGISFVSSAIFIAVTMSLMMTCAECLIKTAMILNVLITVALAITSLLSGMVETILLSSVVAVVTLFYTCSVWNRIPFAAANLTTAVTAVRANIGLLFHAFMSVVFVFGWLLLWIPTLMAVATVFGNESCDENGTCSANLNGIVLFFLLLSFHWTAGVITNVVYVLGLVLSAWILLINGVSTSLSCFILCSLQRVVMLRPLVRLELSGLNRPKRMDVVPGRFAIRTFEASRHPLVVSASVV